MRPLQIVPAGPINTLPRPAQNPTEIWVKVQKSDLIKPNQTNHAITVLGLQSLCEEYFKPILLVLVLVLDFQRFSRTRTRPTTNMV
jgi:hypothetical protein